MSRLISRSASREGQGGFTLVELLAVSAVLAVAAAAMAPVIGVLRSYQKTADEDRQNAVNQRIADGLMTYAKLSTTGTSSAGRLPAQYSNAAAGTALYNVPFNPDATAGTELAVKNTFAELGLPLNQINDDGSAARNQRVYIKIDRSASLPLYSSGAGPLISVPYDVGVIYSTKCPWNVSSCNTSTGGTKPGPSPFFGSSNYTTFKTTGSDSPAVYMSSLPLQLDLVKELARRTDVLKKAFVAYYEAKKAAGGGGVGTNWFPNETGASAAGTLTGQTPGTNNGCRDGWYELSSTHSAILGYIGLTSEYGLTPWGMKIQYCRDYDPAATTANSAPHFGALRIRDTSNLNIVDATGNIILPF